MKTDPHFTTWDGFQHHYQGECGYYYVTSCNNTEGLDDNAAHSVVPFEISGLY